MKHKIEIEFINDGFLTTWLATLKRKKDRPSMDIWVAIDHVAAPGYMDLQKEIGNKGWLDKVKGRPENQ